MRKLLRYCTFYHALPWGKTNVKESATAPHEALFSWNTVIQAIKAAVQIKDPIADRIT